MAKTDLRYQTVDQACRPCMKYSEQFAAFRKARGLSQQQLAKLAHCHRNTVINVEMGRSVKFETVARLMERMGFARTSPETKLLAVLWLKAVTGIDVTLPEAGSLRPMVEAGNPEMRHRRQHHRDLAEHLGPRELDLLGFAAASPEIMDVLRLLRRIVPRKNPTRAR